MQINEATKKGSVFEATEKGWFTFFSTFRFSPFSVASSQIALFYLITQILHELNSFGYDLVLQKKLLMEFPITEKHVQYNDVHLPEVHLMI